MTEMRLFALALFAGAAFAQTAEFEVASIRPAPMPGGDRPVRVGIGVANGRFTGSFVSVRMLIEHGYQILPFQLSGPDWIDRERFAIQATVAPEVTFEQTRPMVRKLLADRFGLNLRRETEEQSTYALQVREAGKLRPTATPGRPLTRRTASTANGNVSFEYLANTMAQFAATLARETGRMVLDETGLDGEYDFTIMVEREVDAKGVAVMLLAPAIGQAGLRLDSRRGMVDLYTIEAVERPSEN